VDKKTLKLLDPYDLIIECTDNLETRFLIGAYCHRKRKPLIHTAASGTHAIVKLFLNKPCFSCMYQGKRDTLSCDARTIPPRFVRAIVKEVIAMVRALERRDHSFDTFLNSALRITAKGLIALASHKCRMRRVRHWSEAQATRCESSCALRQRDLPIQRGAHPRAVSHRQQEHDPLPRRQGADQGA